jgi:NADPH2:quinone reductase
VGAAAGLTPERIGETVEQVYEWIRAGKLTMDIEQVRLKDIEKVWARKDFQGTRVVIVP